MRLGKRLLHGTALNIADQALRFIAVFVMTPIIILSLGDERYGFWAVLMSIVGHYSLLDFGLSVSISRFFAKALGKEDMGELSRTVATALHIFFRIGGLGLLISAGAFLAVPLFVEDPEQLRLARFIIVLYGVFICVGFPVRVFRSFLKSQLRYDRVVMASVVQIIVGNTLIYLYLKADYGSELYALAIINVGAGLLEYGIVMMSGIKEMRRAGVTKMGADRGIRGDLLRFSLTSFFTGLGTQLRSQIDPVIIAWVVGLASVTYYKVGMIFPIFFTDVVGAVLGGQLLALFSQLHGRGDSEKLNQTFLTSTKASAVIATFCGSGLIFYGADFIEVWMKGGYETSFQVMAILAVPFVFLLMQYPSLSLLWSLGKHRYVMWMMLGGGVGNVVLSVILAQWLDMFGVVWATVVEMTIVYLIVFPWIVIRVTGIPAAKLYLDALLLPVLKTAALLVPFYLLSRQFLQPEFGRLAILGVVQCVYFLPLAFFLVPSRGERELVFEVLRNRNDG